MCVTDRVDVDYRTSIGLEKEASFGATEFRQRGGCSSNVGRCRTEGKATESVQKGL